MKCVRLWFSSVAQSCPTLCNPMDCSTPGFPVRLGQMERHIMLLDLHINLFQFHSGNRFIFSWIQFSSVAQLCLTLQHMDYSTWGFPIRHQLLELAQTHIHRVSDAIQPSHPFLSPSSTAFNLYQHQGLFHWVSSSHQVAKVLEFQL